MSTSYQRIVIEATGTTADFKSVCDLTPGQLPALQNFENYIGAVSGGQQSAKLLCKVGAVRATATMTSTGTATAAEIFTLCNVVFTARASNPSANEFVVSGTVATQAANIAAAINASANLTGIVTATSSLGVVTITSVVPGLLGNAFQYSEALTNVTIVAFAGGTDGTAYTLNFL
jgi:hypothetical protein